MRRSPTAPAWRPPLWVVAAGAVVAAGLLVAALHVPHGSARPGDGPWDAEMAGPALVAESLVAGLMTGLLSLAGVLAARFGRSGVPPRMDAAGRLTLGFCAGVATFALLLLVVPPAAGPARAGFIAASVGTLAALVLFVGAADRLARALGPEAEAEQVSAAALRAIARRRALPTPQAEARPATAPVRVIVSPRTGIIQSIDAGRLAGRAGRHGWRIVVPHAVGDPVEAGAPLLEVHGAGRDLPVLGLRGAVRIGRDRLLDDGPAHAVRVLADLAIRALSPASLDPTTAVRIIDRLEPVLAELGRERLDGVWAVADREGRPCVEVLCPTWPDVLAVALTEIREYGESSPQVTRRLRAMLDALRRGVSPEHRNAVDIELAELSCSVRRGFPDPVLRRFAAHPDRRGIGGASPSGDTTAGPAT